jgi:hypothetical protein
VRRQQLNVYVDENKLDLKNKAETQALMDRALNAATVHSFKGVRVFTQSGQRLFYTGRGPGGAKMIRD